MHGKGSSRKRSVDAFLKSHGRTAKEIDESELRALAGPESRPRKGKAAPGPASGGGAADGPGSPRDAVDGLDWRISPEKDVEKGAGTPFVAFSFILFAAAAAAGACVMLLLLPGRVGSSLARAAPFIDVRSGMTLAGFVSANPLCFIGGVLALVGFQALYYAFNLLAKKRKGGGYERKGVTLSILLSVATLAAALAFAWYFNLV
ncbi:MAG: hypothetical protein PHF51_01090 [Candidatus ainarchaeum sp.]|nr:hypothetical protein [Candidatus ainarchaeum sp.]